MQDLTTVSAGKHPAATGMGTETLGAIGARGLQPPKSLLQASWGLLLTGGSSEPCAGFPAGFVLGSCHALTLRWEERPGCSP